MERLFGFIAIAITGCSAVFGIGDPAPAPDAPPRPSCLIGGFDLCANQNANGPIAFTTSTSINTTVDCSLVLYEPSVGGICVIFATDITIAAAATVNATGLRPLVLAATQTITVDGTVDVSSYLAPPTGVASQGAAANHPSCEQLRIPTCETTNYGCGGQAGGSFGGLGGAGGLGPSGLQNGLPGDPIPPPLPRGGCPGGSRNDNDSDGGGGVWLVAGSAIAVTVTGRVLAGGAGGQGGYGGIGGELYSSGNGGGSGGYIRLAAPSIRVEGSLIANGGGGGEGGDGTFSMAANGGDGAGAMQPPRGGVSTRAGGDGGDGATGSMLGGQPGKSSTNTQGAGGGGGGGGAGIIVLSAPALVTTGATISPTPL